MENFYETQKFKTLGVFDKGILEQIRRNNFSQ